MLLKGMGGRFLLSEDEPLTPNIDGVMRHFDFLEGGPKRPKIGVNRRKLDLSILVFIFFAPAPLPVRANFSGVTLGANEAPEKCERLGLF